jgi:hypothetical protein
VLFVRGYPFILFRTPVNWLPLSEISKNRNNCSVAPLLNSLESQKERHLFLTCTWIAQNFNPADLMIPVKAPPSLIRGSIGLQRAGKIFLFSPDNGRMIQRRRIMTETGGTGINPVQEKKLKKAVENTCELCHEYFSPEFLELHLIYHRSCKEMTRDPSTRILVVCQPCHTHIHALPLPAGRQLEIVRRRSFFIRKDLRRVLGYVPKPYQAPDDINLYVIYEEYMGRPSPGSYRTGRE